MKIIGSPMTVRTRLLTVCGRLYKEGSGFFWDLSVGENKTSKLYLAKADESSKTENEAYLKMKVTLISELKVLKMDTSVVAELQRLRERTCQVDLFGVA